MPHIKFTSPYKTSDGKTRKQGETVYVSSKDARGILADKRGEVVHPTGAEVVELATGKPPKPKPAAKPGPAEASTGVEAKQPRKPASDESKKTEDG